MTKRIINYIVLLTASFFLFAGDVARFVEMGFSADGKTYFFGQYGKKDKTFLPYAEIFAVDVQKNDFVKTFKSQGTAQTQSGRDTFEELRARNQSFLTSFNCSSVPAKQILYLREDDARPASDTLEFSDFEFSTRSNPVYYSVRIVPSVTGRGKNTQSSFYIVLERKNQAGMVLERATVGNPDIKRAGVLGYRIEKIFTDPAGKNLVFVIEKTIEDDDGISVRYMVETIVLK